MQQYYSYYPKFFDDDKIFHILYNQLVNICQPAIFNFYGNITIGKRISCAFSKRSDMNGYTYAQTPVSLWNDAPKELIYMKDKILENFGYEIDYVLVHIYRDWDDKIAGIVIEKH